MCVGGMGSGKNAYKTPADQSMEYSLFFFFFCVSHLFFICYCDLAAVVQEYMYKMGIKIWVSLRFLWTSCLFMGFKRSGSIVVKNDPK